MPSGGNMAFLFWITEMLIYAYFGMLSCESRVLSRERNALSRVYRSKLYVHLTVLQKLLYVHLSVRQ